MSTNPAQRAAAAAPLTTRGWCFAILAVIALLAAQVMGRRDLLAAGIFMAALPIAGLLFLRWSQPALKAHRSFTPELARAGEPVEVSVRISGQIRSPLRATEDVDGSLSDPLQFSISPSPGGTVLRYSLHPTHRGSYSVGPLLVTREDPLGMARRRVAATAADTLIVSPALSDLPGVPDQGQLNDIGARTAARRRHQTELDTTTREHQPGDALQRVHWPASARHGQLMVRQEETTTPPSAALVLDDRLDAWLNRAGAAFAQTRGGLISEPGFEAAVQGTLSIAQRLTDAGLDVTVCAADGGSLFSGFRGASGASEAADPAPALRLSGSGRNTDIEELARGLATLDLRRDADVDAFAAGLRGALTERASRDVFILTATTNPDDVKALLDLDPGANMNIAFIVRHPEAMQETLAALHAVGWNAVAVDERTSVSALWQQLLGGSPVTSPQSGANSGASPAAANRRPGARP